MSEELLDAWLLDSELDIELLELLLIALLDLLVVGVPPPLPPPQPARVALNKAIVTERQCRRLIIGWVIEGLAIIV